MSLFDNRMVNEFIRQCPYCQISNRLKIPIKTHPFTCTSYNSVRYQKMHMEMKTSLLLLMLFPDGWSYSPPNQRQLLKQHLFHLIILIDSVHPKLSIPAFYNELVTELLRLGGIEQSLPQHTQARTMTSWSMPIKRYYAT
jgi:hypothetical protein